MDFDRSKIAHITNPEYGYALVNGCQGIFLDEIFWSHEDALARFDELKRADYGEDEQIVPVEVRMIVPSEQSAVRVDHSVSAEDIREAVRQIRVESYAPKAHAREDELYLDVLKAIASGAQNPAELAAEALKTQEIHFDRWYE